MSNNRPLRGSMIDNAVRALVAADRALRSADLQRLVAGVCETDKQVHDVIRDLRRRGYIARFTFATAKARERAAE